MIRASSRPGARSGADGSRAPGAPPRAFSLLELIVVIGLLLSVCGVVVEVGRLLLRGFASGEQKFSELREASILLDHLRDDLDCLDVAPLKNGLPPFEYPDAGAFTPYSMDGHRLEMRCRREETALVTYAFDLLQAVVTRRVTGEKETVVFGGGSETDLGLVETCRFRWGVLHRLPDGSLVDHRGPLVPPFFVAEAGSVRRLFLNVHLRLRAVKASRDGQPPSELAHPTAPFEFETNLFPTWANRRLSSHWNR